MAYEQEDNKFIIGPCDMFGDHRVDIGTICSHGSSKDREEAIEEILDGHWCLMQTSNNLNAWKSVAHHTTVEDCTTRPDACQITYDYYSDHYGHPEYSCTVYDPNGYLILADAFEWVCDGYCAYNNSGHSDTCDPSATESYVYQYDYDGNNNCIRAHWRIYGGLIGTYAHYKYVSDPSTITCPDGYYYTHGTCCPNGYEWNPVLNECKATGCLDCYYIEFPNIDCNGGIYEFNIKYRDNGLCGNMTIAERPVQLSYAGSPAGVMGVTELMVDISKEDNHFYVYIPPGACEGDNLNIEIIWPETVNRTHIPDCESRISIPLCGECDENNGDSGNGGDGEGPGWPGGPPGMWEPGIPKGTDCCEFFNDTYTGWQETDNFYCEDFFKDYPMRY